MGIKLSHTQVNMYHECGEKYRLHYIEKLREPTLRSPLFFGKALDEGFNRILLEKKKELTEEERELLTKTEHNIFRENMEYTNHNRQHVYIPTYENARYFKSDFTPDTLTDEDIQSIINIAHEMDIELGSKKDIVDFIEEIDLLIKKKSTLDNEEQIVYNYIVWASLVRKGYMMLDAYREQILPEIHEVYALQKKVRSEEGEDAFEGFIDIKVSFRDFPDKIYTADNKTSSKPYSDNSAEDSDQLSTYDELDGGSGFISYLVVLKQLYKKPPYIRTQIIRSEVVPENVDRTFNKIQEAYEGIKSGTFTKNFASRCYFYGSPCPYYKKCHFGNEKDLVKIYAEIVDDKLGKE